MSRGSKPGERRGGRKPGTPNKATVAKNKIFDAVLRQFRKLGPDAIKSPLDILQFIYRCPHLPMKMRMNAAIACLPYECEKLKAKLITVHMPVATYATSSPAEVMAWVDKAVHAQNPNLTRPKPQPQFEGDGKAAIGHDRAALNRGPSDAATGRARSTAAPHQPPARKVVRAIPRPMPFDTLNSIPPDLRQLASKLATSVNVRAPVRSTG